MVTEKINNLVKVDRSKPFVPHPLITTEFGELQIKWEHPLAAKITEFDLREDVIFKTYERNNWIISIEDTYNRMELDHIPLDAHCLQTIWQNKHLLQTLKDMCWRGLHMPTIRTLNFVGSLFTDNYIPGPNLHIVCIEYSVMDFHNKPKIMPYEIYDAGWGEEDPILIFNPRSKLVKNLL